MSYLWLVVAYNAMVEWSKNKKLKNQNFQKDFSLLEISAPVFINDPFLNLQLSFIAHTTFLHKKISKKSKTEILNRTPILENHTLVSNDFYS